MPNEQDRDFFKRRLSPLEQMFLHSPYAVVTIVLRILGNITDDMFIAAVQNTAKLHPFLRVRIHIDHDDRYWFTSKEVLEITTKIIQRESNTHWVEVAQETCRQPFDFQTNPAIRFILIQSPLVSEVVIACHHTICDGMSLAFLGRDLMDQLAHPNPNVAKVNEAVPMGQNNLPAGVSMNPIERYFINRFNRRWLQEEVRFTQDDYLDLNAAYWERFNHQMIPVEFSEAETNALVERCRQESVTVNSALTMAFTGAQQAVAGKRKYNPRTAVAGNVRDRLPNPPGEAMGFYAGAVIESVKYNPKIGFWENTQKLHDKLRSSYTDKKLFAEPLVWSHLHPGIMHSLHFKMMGSLVPEYAASYAKLSAFSSRSDVISFLLKREKMDSFENTLLGTAVTNLTRLDISAAYENLELDRIYLKPGGAYPLVFVPIVLGAVTVAEKLSLVIEFAEEVMGLADARKIKESALDFLLNS